MFSAERLRHGSDTPPPPSIPLRAGAFTLIYNDGDLRYLKYAGREVVRRVYAAVRDKDWGTPPARLENVEMDIRDDSFTISYDAIHQQNEINFRWHAAITGTADSTITFTFSGEAHSTFVRSRIGFCILHPIDECAGEPVQIEHVDGAIEQGRFPELIAPHQPFFDIRAITHDVTPTARAEVRMQGEAFEMEDQRNWTDASYKTYGTPLRLPYPIEIAAGTRIEQTVTIRLLSDAPLEAPTPAPDVVTIRLADRPASPLTPLGVLMAVQGGPLTPLQTERVRALHPDHLRADVRPADGAIEAQLRRAAAQADAIGVPLVLGVTVTQESERELLALAEALDEVKPLVRLLLVYAEGESSISETTLETARAALSRFNFPIGGGTRGNFTDMNRSRPPADRLAAAAFPVNPQVHATDNLSLGEMPETLPSIARTARAFLGGTAVHFSPIALRGRHQPHLTADDAPAPAEPPPDADSRQASLWGAAWTLAIVKYLAEGGADGAALFETVGHLGVMDDANVYPLYHVLADVGAFAAGQVTPVEVSDRRQAAALLLERDSTRALLIANWTDAPIELARAGVLEGATTVRLLDESNTMEAMHDPAAFAAYDQPAWAEDVLLLPPFAYARVRFSSG